MTMEGDQDCMSASFRACFQTPECSVMWLPPATGREGGTTTSSSTVTEVRQSLSTYIIGY
uniref:Uncharacterized protein n=1 Tax=Centropages dorsispinatus TaxID=1239308 RepID=A0A0U2LGF3_9MAXI|nr:hypothetical protein [Centropages dorsispinatus]